MVKLGSVNIAGVTQIWREIFFMRNKFVDEKQPGPVTESHLTSDVLISRICFFDYSINECLALRSFLGFTHELSNWLFGKHQQPIGLYDQC